MLHMLKDDKQHSILNPPLKCFLSSCVSITTKNLLLLLLSFPDGSSGKESTCNSSDTGDLGSIPGWGRSPGKGNGNPLQYSCLENPKDRGDWWAIVHRVYIYQCYKIYCYINIITTKLLIYWQPLPLFKVTS